MGPGTSSGCFLSTIQPPNCPTLGKEQLICWAIVQFVHMIAAPGGAVVSVKSLQALHQAACSDVVVGDRVSALCVSRQCLCIHSACENAASSGVSSCAGRGGRIWKRSVSRRRTGRVWHLCASGSDASAHPNERNASHSSPMCTCTASHLQDGRKERG